MRDRSRVSDSGWVGAGEEDDLDRRLAAEEEPFDLRRPHVMTALGPIEPAALGPTLAAERVGSTTPAPAGDDGPPADRDATLAELEDLYAAGGRALLDPTTADEGRDVGALRWLAARAPVHLLAVTGVARPAGSTAADPDAVARLAATFVRELTEGIDGGPTRAGAIVVGAEDAAASDGVLRAAARAHRSTGAPLLLRTSHPAAARAALATLRTDGVDPAVVVVGGGGRPNEADLAPLLAAGVSVVFDRLAADPAWPASAQAATIRALAAAGYGDRLLLSPGLDHRSLRAAGGEPGWVWLLERFALTLMETGLDAPTVRRLLVDNPTRALTIDRDRGGREEPKGTER